jgi:hypothetical protein
MGLYSSRELHLDRNIIMGYIDERLKNNTVHDELEKKYEVLRIEHESLKREYKKLLSSSTEVNIVESKISEEAVQKFVQNILSNPDTNIYMVPDAIESSVYKSTLMAVLHSLAHFADASHISFMGHRVKISIVPEEK